MNDYYKGEKIGYIIGKYGIEIFAPLGVMKGVTKLKAFKRANAMYTLECCDVSQGKKAKILEESTKRAAIRETLIKEAKKSNKLLVKTDNVCNHVMQDHHHWEKIMKLTGDVMEDFKNLVKLLEDNHITNKANI